MSDEKYAALTEAEFELLFDAARLASPSRSVALKAARALVAREESPTMGAIQYVALDRREAEMILDYFRLSSPARALALKMVTLVGEWEADATREMAAGALADAAALLEMGRLAHVLEPPALGEEPCEPYDCQESAEA